VSTRKNTPKNRAALESGIGLTAAQRGHRMGDWSDKSGTMPGRISVCAVCGMTGAYYFEEMKAVGSVVYVGCKQPS